MKNLKNKIYQQLSDLAEVAVTIAIIIILSKIFLGPQMLIPLVAVTSGSMEHTDDGWRNWLISKGIPPEEISKFPMQNGFNKGDMILTITPDDKGTIIPIFPETKLGDVVIYNRDKKHPGSESIIHRVVGIVEVENWSIRNVTGTLDCLSEEDFRNTYIPYVKNCVNKQNCPYTQFPETGDFRFYMTKGDNQQTNMVTDQCGKNGGIALPVTDAQLIARGWIRIPYVGHLKLLLNYLLGLG